MSAMALVGGFAVAGTYAVKRGPAFWGGLVVGLLAIERVGRVPSSVGTVGTAYRVSLALLLADAFGLVPS